MTIFVVRKIRERNTEEAKERREREISRGVESGGSNGRKETRNFFFSNKNKERQENAGLSQSRRVLKRIMSGVPSFLRRKERQVCLQRVVGRGVTGGLCGTREPMGTAVGSEVGTQEGIH